MTENVDQDLQLQIVMPVHNEGASIAQTLREWHAALSDRLRIQFVICEDGSTDDTKDVLAEIARELPALLDMTDERRGYAQAVVAAFRATTAPHVLAVDSDGQCDPADFWDFWEKRDEGDVVMGWRVDRADARWRKIMSGSFRLLHRLLFSVKLHDSSCPYLLISRPVLEKTLPSLGLMTEGFWWEFVARVTSAGFRIVETPVRHRHRAAGSTVVYSPRRIPGIAIRNGLGLFKVWAQTRRS